jgi:hypothetical protein
VTTLLIDQNLKSAGHYSDDLGKEVSVLPWNVNLKLESMICQPGVTVMDPVNSLRLGNLTY